MKTYLERQDIRNICFLWERLFAYLTSYDVAIQYIEDKDEIDVTIRSWESGDVVYHQTVNVACSSVSASILDFTEQCLVPYIKQKVL